MSNSKYFLEICVGLQEKRLIKEELEINFHVMLVVSRDEFVMFKF